MGDKDFRLEIEKLLVSEGYWGKFDWLNNATSNYLMIEHLKARIAKHPIIWRLFFKLS